VRIKNAKRYFLIGLFPSYPSIFSIKEIRDRLISTCKSVLSRDEWDFFHSRLGKSIFWHIIDMEDFQAFLSLPVHRRRFGYELRRYLRSANIDTSTLEDGMIAMNFRSYILSNCRHKPDYVSEEYSDIKSFLQSTYFEAFEKSFEVIYK
jgi:hypothetical protein